MVNKHGTVAALVSQDLSSKLEQGFTVDQIKSLSNSDINSYESYFRQTYAHRINYPFKNGTINRCVEQWLKRQVK